MTLVTDLHEETRKTRQTLRELLAELDDITRDLREEVALQRGEDEVDDDRK